MHYSLRAPSALLFRLTLTKKSIHLSLHMQFEARPGGTEAVMHSIQPHGIESILSILLYHGSEFNAPNHQGGPQGWVRWVKTKSFSVMIFKIGPFFSIWKHYLPTMVSVVQGVKFLYHWLLLHFKSNTLNGFGKWGYHVLIHQICLASPNMFFSCVMVSASGLL